MFSPMPNNLIPHIKIKAVISDLDNTLWDGILAEHQELHLRQEYYEALQAMREKGVLIFFVSKNNESDVQRAFEKLGIDSNLAAGVIANWDPKYLNVEALIESTKLRPETVFLIDDNPFERSEVAKKVDQLHVLADDEWQQLMDNVSSMPDQPTTEVESRINRYRTALSAKQSKTGVAENEAFLKSLERQLSIGSISPDQLDRFTRLLVETHRINFNPHKFADYDDALAYLHERLNDGNQLYAISTSEAGLSLGLTGALVIETNGDTATITDGTFSCGIMGRGFEEKTLWYLLKDLNERDVKKVFVNVAMTQTNQRIVEMLKTFGIQQEYVSSDESEQKKAVFSGILANLLLDDPCEWISVSQSPPDLNYTGIRTVIQFFDKHVKPLFKKGDHITNLGSAQGEVLGLNNRAEKDAWNILLLEQDITLTNVDIESYADVPSIVADAEDLRGVIEDASQDLVVAIELLEHTEHFWNVIHEMIRITKVGGYIYITVPTFDYPKHEYPIDRWRIGPKTLASFFPGTYFSIIQREQEGNNERPRRVQLLVRKDKDYILPTPMAPDGGVTDWKRGLTIFP